MRPLVSVVVPVYNVEAYLARSLESLLGQTLREIEIVCVNDGSTDGSRDILSRYERSDPRVRVIDQENRGLAAARNAGFGQVTGGYVIFLDSDDWFEPDMLERLHTACSIHDADVAACVIRYQYTDSGSWLDAPWSLRTDLLPQGEAFSPDEMRGRLFRFVTPAAWNKMYRREFLMQRAASFHEDLRRAEDLPFTYLALSAAARITVVKKALVNYRVGRAEGLQATMHEKPLEICRSLSYLMQDLKGLGLFESVEQDFVNLALDQCLFSLDTMKTWEGFTTLFSALHGSYLQSLGIDGRDREFFYQREAYDRLLMLRTQDEAGYLFTLASAHRQALDGQRQRIEKAELAIRSATDESRRIRDSRAFRLAAAVTALPRATARTLRSLRSS